MCIWRYSVILLTRNGTFQARLNDGSMPPFAKTILSCTVCPDCRVVQVLCILLLTLPLSGNPGSRSLLLFLAHQWLGVFLRVSSILPLLWLHLPDYSGRPAVLLGTLHMGLQGWVGLWYRYGGTWGNSWYIQRDQWARHSLHWHY